MPPVVVTKHSSLVSMVTVDDSAAENSAPVPGAECLECSAALSYVGHGRRPRYCSNTCRHRAWERRRAAAEGTIATRVVELPRPAPKAPLDRDTVAAWLAQRPGRLAAVLAALPDDLEPEKALCAALNRIRTHGTTPGAYTHLESYQIHVGERWQRQADQRAATLRAERDRLRDELAHTTESPSAASDDRQPYTAGPMAWNRATTDATEQDTKVVEVGGKSFRVPTTWTRQQARQWCRTHPERALP